MTTTGWRGSVVIPAHNEAAVIEQCLRPLHELARSGSLQVVVVSNGSRDATVELASAALRDAPGSAVVDLEMASKIAALRAGDEHATAYPRLYLDADVRIDSQTVLGLLDQLAATQGPAVAAPVVDVDTSESALLVQAFHRVWASLPYARDGLIGAGVYAVNRAGGERLGSFAHVTNDDEWVRRHFGREESSVSPGVFHVRAPVSVRALVRQKARTELGNAELDRVLPQGAPRSTSWRDLRGVAAGSPRAALDVAAYVTIVVAVRAVARYRQLTGTSRTWSTDLTSRKLVPAEPPASPAETPWQS